MATDVTPEATNVDEAAAVLSGKDLYRITVDEYLKMCEAGVFRDSARIELLGGLLVQKMTKYPPHNLCCGLLGDALKAILPPGWFVSEEKPIAMPRWWRPEPDLFVARGTRRDYAKKDPTPADVPLVIEVSDSSYHKDHGPKLRRYAAAKLPIYWIVNLALRRVEVYRDPAGEGRSAAYREVTHFDEKTEVHVILEGREIGRISVAEILP